MKIKPEIDAQLQMELKDRGLAFNQDRNNAIQLYKIEIDEEENIAIAYFMEIDSESQSRGEILAASTLSAGNFLLVGSRVAGVELTIDSIEGLG